MIKNFFLRKVSILIAALLLVITLSFFLMRLLPGDPFAAEQSMPKETLDSLHRYYGLVQPLLVQYQRYLFSILRFDLGPSFKYTGRSVAAIILESFPISLLLGIEAFILALAGGVISGVVMAFYKGPLLKALFKITLIVLLSVPAYLFATLLQYVLAIKLDLLPLARWGTFSHSILPALSLALFPLAYIARLFYAAIGETLKQDFIATIRATGASEKEVIFKHILPNALMPVIAYCGPLLATIFTGSFVIEKIFGIAGLGQWLIVSIGNRDYPVIMGITIFYSFLLMSCNFIVDCVYQFCYPHLRQ